MRNIKVYLEKHFKRNITNKKFLKNFTESVDEGLSQGQFVKTSIGKVRDQFYWCRQVLFLLRTIYGKLKYFLTVIKMQWFVHNLSTSVFMAQLFEVRTLLRKVKNARQIYQSVLKTKDQYFPTHRAYLGSSAGRTKQNIPSVS